MTSVTAARERHDSSLHGLKATASVLVPLSLALHKTCVSDITTTHDSLSVDIILSSRSSDGGVSQPLQAHSSGEVRRTARTRISCRMVEQHTRKTVGSRDAPKHDYRAVSGSTACARARASRMSNGLPLYAIVFRIRAISRERTVRNDL